MTKIRDWIIMLLLLLRLPMVHAWVICTKRIVQDIPIGERIYEKKIILEVAIFSKASPICENSIQQFKIVVIFSSDRI